MHALCTQHIDFRVFIANFDLTLGMRKKFDVTVEQDSSLQIVTSTLII